VAHTKNDAKSLKTPASDIGMPPDAAALDATMLPSGTDPDATLPFAADPEATVSYGGDADATHPFPVDPDGTLPFPVDPDGTLPFPVDPDGTLPFPMDPDATLPFGAGAEVAGDTGGPDTPGDDANLDATPSARAPEADATMLPSAAPIDATMLPAESATLSPPEFDVTILPPPAGAPADLTRLEPLARPRPASTRRTPAARKTTAPSTAQSSTASHLGASGGQDGPLVVGAAFGPRYHIIRVLGVGGMGAVYQAWDAELGVAVAVKVIRPEIAADPAAAAEIERRFKRELLLARQVTHPNIIRIHDLGDIDGIKYITMPFIEGRDLATILKEEQKLPIERALRIARGTVAGLASAHAAGVIHRDLKPANLMIGEEDAPTVMDFGIARSAGGEGQGKVPSAVPIRPAELSRTAAAAASSTVAGAIVGTVAYMAPEQARGEPVDQRADIYSFGLILYDMLVGGRRSERAPSAIAELQRRMETAPPPPRSIDPGIPEAVDAIIRRCLEPDLLKRFQTTGELQHALERLDENGKPLPIMKRVRRRTMVAAAAVVVLLLSGTFYVTRWMSAPVVEPDPVTVLIADFENSTSDPTFTNALAPSVRRALEDASFIIAYDRVRLPALGVRAPEKLDAVGARELALKQGLGVVFAGAVSPRGDGFEISVKASQTITGEEIASVSAVASGKDQVLDTATRLVARVRRALGDRTSESDQMFAMRTISTSSLDVLSHYAGAVEAQSKGQYENARQSYLRAVELDPKFGLGYQGLAAMSANLGKTEDAQNYIKEALRYVDGLTDRERFFTRGAYYRLMNDNAQCAKEYGELLVRFPADSAARANRAACLYTTNIRQALEEMRQAVAVLPNHVGYRINLALIADRAGEFQTAEDELKPLPQMDSRALLALAYSQLGRGLSQEATATYKRMAAQDPSAPWAHSGVADVLAYHGEYSEAAKIFAADAAADVKAKNASRAAIKFTSLAHAYLMAGQNRPAATAAQEALQHGDRVPVKFLAGQILVEVGSLDKATEIAAQLSNQLTDEARAHGKILDAQIALKKKDHFQAVKLLTEANATRDTWLGHFVLGQAYLAAKEFVRADSEFDLCITRRGEALSVMDEGPTFGRLPLAYYYRGLAREEMGTASFADSYREYIRIRGTSSEDLVVRELRKRGVV
jgi:serine/threonine protein kinase/tetratricopeptide (TPR) repeat protein